MGFAVLTLCVSVLCEKAKGEELGSRPCYTPCFSFDEHFVGSNCWFLNR